MLNILKRLWETLVFILFFALLCYGIISIWYEDAEKKEFATNLNNNYLIEESIVVVEIVGVESYSTQTNDTTYYSFYDSSNLVKLSDSVLEDSKGNVPVYTFGDKVELYRRSYKDEAGVLKYYEYKGLDTPYYSTEYNNLSYEEKQNYLAP